MCAENYCAAIASHIPKMTRFLEENYLAQVPMEVSSSAHASQVNGSTAQSQSIQFYQI